MQALARLLQWTFNQETCSNTNIKHHHTTVQTILLKVNSLQRVTKFMLICIYFFKFYSTSWLYLYYMIVFLDLHLDCSINYSFTCKVHHCKTEETVKIYTCKSYYIIQICSQFTASKNKLYRKTIYLYNNTMISVIVKDYKVAWPTCIKSGSSVSSNFRVKFSKQNLITEPGQ